LANYGYDELKLGVFLKRCSKCRKTNRKSDKTNTKSFTQKEEKSNYRKISDSSKNDNLCNSCTSLIKMEEQNQIEIYQAKDGTTQINVQFEQETVWLNQEQLTQLFNRDRTVIGRHIRNIFKEGELKEGVVCANFAHTTQHGAIKGKTQIKNTKHYNLDVIISVGYRVKSQQGTQFRIWANQVLKEYLVKGYAINEKRLAQNEQEVQILKDGIHILGRAIEEKTADNEWLTVFAKGLSLLDDYDH
jgi:hypothetical protein